MFVLAAGDDLDEVREQLQEVAAMKEEVVPRHVDVEFLNQQAADLTKSATAQQSATIREPLQVRMGKQTRVSKTTCTAHVDPYRKVGSQHVSSVSHCIFTCD